MAIGNYYPVSGTVVDQDLFLGTKAGNNNTVNYTAQTVANYLNTNSKIAIGGQISFRFDISPNIPKTISFSGGGGSGTPFASITQLIVSGIDLSSTDITIFLNYLNGSEILLAQQNQPNLFGNYKITGYTQIGTSNFYTLDLQFIGGNGTITENTYYNISSFVLSSGIDVPTLNQVLTAGNTSVIDAKVGNLYSYDNLNVDYGIVQFYDGGVSLKAATTNNLLFYNDATGSVSFSNGTYLPTLNFAGVGNNVYTFQNANGTLAFLSDIPSLSGYVPTSRTLTINGTSYDLTANRSWSVGTVTSVGLSMPPAFNVSSSPVTGSGTIAVTGAGVASQYIRGDGTLANFPTSTGGGASVSYYLNGSISQGTIGGVAYKEMNSVPVIGAGTDFTINADGYIAQFITDVGDPNKLLIPGGNWNFETYFSASSGGGSPRFYVELYKYDGTTFTLIASNSASPRLITDGTNIEAYFSALAVPATTLLVTDRLAVRFYVIHSGRTITMHTENSHLCQVITTFSSGLTALNGLTSQVQYFAVGTSGTDFNISSATDTHTFNLPTASAVNRGALSSADWTAFNSKASASGTTNYVAKFTGATAIGNSQIFDNGTNVGIGIALPEAKLEVVGSSSSGLQEVLRLRGTEAGGAVQGGPYISLRPVNTDPLLKNWELARVAASSVAFSYASNLLFYTNTGVAYTDITEKMRISSSGNVGIGTTAPGARLDVRAQGALSTDIAFKVRNSTDTADFIAVNGLGNVGIGTTASTEKLTVWNDTAASIGIHTNREIAGDLAILRFSTVTNGDADARKKGAIFFKANGTGNGRGDLQFAVNNAADSSNAGVANAVMTLQSDGNVGIGTAAPTTKLQVSGDANGILSLGRFENTNVGNAVQSRIQVVSGTATAQIQMFGSGHSTTPRLFRLSGSSDGGDMYLATGGVDRLAITLAGNVGIGTTAPVVKLAVAGTTTDTLRIGQTENLTGNKYMVLGMNVASQYAQIEATRYGEAYLPVVINPSGGNVGIGTTTPVARLHVAAQGALSTDIAIRVRNSANTADLFNVNGNGNVGIGTTTPASILDVQSTAAAIGTTLKVSNTSASGGNYLQLDRATNSRVNALNFSTAGVEDWSLGILRNTGSATQIFSLSYQTAGNINSTGFAVTNTGNVGIGTISPSVKLHTVGDGLFSSNTNTNLTINSNGGVSILTLTTAAGAQSIYGGVGGLNNMDFYTASGFRMRIDPTGNVGIGTSTPQGRLDVRAPGALTIDTAFRVRNSADSNNLIIINGAGGIGVGTTSPLPSAVLDINSTTQGFLPPRMTNAQRLAISLPAVGLMVYCTDATEGLYIYKSTGWTFII
jgi:hypothetical protein